MKKVLLAEGNRELLQMLTRQLGGEFDLCGCWDGGQVLAAVAEFRPCLLVLDLTLPGTDGLSLLRAMKDAGNLPATLVTAAYLSPYILSTLEACQVDYLMRRPCSAEAVAGQIRALTATLEPAPRPLPEPGLSVSSMLLALDFSPKNDGFSHLVNAIPQYARDPAQGLTKELYTSVGHRCGKSGQQVERSIRTAIASAWMKGSPERWRQYFPTAPDGTIPRPTNGDFIARLATLLVAEDGRR